MKHLANNKGFTLVELLIAMAVFGMMLSIVLVGFINIVRIQQAGIASRSTQQTTRDLADIITSSIRTSKTAWTAPGPAPSSNHNLCLSDTGGTTEYALVANGASYDLYVANVPSLQPSCPAPPSLVGWRKLNDDSVAIPLFQATASNSVNGSLGTVSMTIGSASRDDLTDTVVSPNADISQSTVTCAHAAGSQFCAASTITNTTTLRGSN